MEPTVDIQGLELYAEKNAGNHKTDKYELVLSGTPVYRRATSFFMDVKSVGRAFDFTKDKVKLTFEFGNFQFITRNLAFK